MLAFIGLSVLTFLVIALIVGVRLFMVAFRTGGLPEWMMALGTLLIGLIGYPYISLSGFEVRPVGDVNLPAFALGFLANAAGIGCFNIFTWRVFRPEAPFAAGVALAASAASMLSALGCIQGLAMSPADLPSHLAARGWFLVAFGLSMIPFGWSAWESLGHWAKMRRRRVLGLADPVVTNRFLLWGIFGGMSLLTSLLHYAYYLAGSSPAQNDVVPMATALSCLVTGTSMFLCFSPPRRYTEFLLRRAQPEPVYV